MTSTVKSTVLYWIAINGSSCAISTLPLRQPFKVAPTPQFLFGFPTLEAAKSAQRCCLESPIEAVRREMLAWARRGDVTFVRMPNPEPQTAGQTVWMEL